MQWHTVPLWSIVRGGVLADRENTEGAGGDDGRGAKLCSRGEDCAAGANRGVRCRGAEPAHACIAECTGEGGTPNVVAAVAVECRFVLLKLRRLFAA